MQTYHYRQTHHYRPARRGKAQPLTWRANPPGALGRRWSLFKSVDGTHTPQAEAQKLSASTWGRFGRIVLVQDSACPRPPQRARRLQPAVARLAPRRRCLGEGAQGGGSARLVPSVSRCTLAQPIPRNASWLTAPAAPAGPHNRDDRVISSSIEPPIHVVTLLAARSAVASPRRRDDPSEDAVQALLRGVNL